jgi:hypothetical protein
MAITAASFSTVATPSSTVSVPAQAGVGLGDLLLIWVVSQVAAMTFSVTAGSGSWNAVTASTGQNCSAQLLWKAADSTDVSLSGSSGSYTVTASVLHSMAGIVVAGPGAAFDPSTPASSGQLLVAAGTTITATGLTTTSSGDLLLWFGGSRFPSGSSGTITQPAGYSVAVTQVSTSVGGSANVGAMLATQTQGSAGATGNQSGTLGAALDDGGALLVALTQPSGASPNAGLAASAGVPGTPAASVAMAMTIQGV